MKLRYFTQYVLHALINTYNYEQKRMKSEVFFRCIKIITQDFPRRIVFTLKKNGKEMSWARKTNPLLTIGSGRLTDGRSKAGS